MHQHPFRLIKEEWTMIRHNQLQGTIAVKNEELQLSF